MRSQSSLGTSGGEQGEQEFQIDIGKINKKIHALKVALSKAENHNEQLHFRLIAENQAYQQEINTLNSECLRYRELYEQQLQRYAAKSNEYRQLRKRYKKMGNIELQNQHSQRQNQEYLQETKKECKQIIRKEQNKAETLQVENRKHMLELKEWKQKCAQLEQSLQKQQQQLHGYQKSVAKEILERDQLLQQLKAAFQQSSAERETLKQDLKKKGKEVQQYRAEFTHLQNKIQAQKVEMEQLKLEDGQLKTCLQQKDSAMATLRHEYSSLNDKYSQTLMFHYDLQKDFERELYGITKELTRREKVKQHH